MTTFEFHAIFMQSRFKIAWIAWISELLQGDSSASSLCVDIDPSSIYALLSRRFGLSILPPFASENPAKFQQFRRLLADASGGELWHSSAPAPHSQKWAEHSQCLILALLCRVSSVAAIRVEMEMMFFAIGGFKWRGTEWRLKCGQRRCLCFLAPLCPV